MPKLNFDFRGLVHLGNMSKGYFVTTVINQALPFLILPILTRYLVPSEYGHLGLFTFYLSLSHALAGVAVHNVISKMFFNQPRSALAQTIGNAVLVVGVLSACLLAIILIFRNYLVAVLDLPLFWLAIIPFASFAFIIFNMGLTILRNAKKVVVFGVHQSGNTVANIVISLVLIIVFLWGWQGRALGIVVSYFISSIITLIYLRKHGYLSFQFSKRVVNNILQIILPLIPNSFQSVIIIQAGIFFINYYFTKELLGVFTIGFQISAVIKLLVDTLNMSWSPFLYEQLSNRKSMNKLYLTRLMIALGGILLAGVVVISLTSGFILRLMTTPQYFAAQEFIPWLSVGLLFHGLYIMLFPILISYNKQRFVSIVSFLNMILLLVLNIWFVNLFGYMGVAYALCGTYFVMFVAFFIQAQHLLPLPWLRALKFWK